MIRNAKLGLRARHESDVPVLHEELYNDVHTRSRADSRPWQPISPSSSSSPYAVVEPNDGAACFSIVDANTDELVGEAIVWGIDAHNRVAHLGISLRPRFRGKGLSGDVVELLCVYAFRVRGLHRVQLETLVDNGAMIATAERLGFTREGVLRQAVWAGGVRADQLVYGLLSDEWSAAPTD